MVAIKIQSLEDIVRAYLQNLGYGGAELENGVKLIAGHLGADFAGDILKALDEKTAQIAVQVVRDRQLNKEQKLAAFKLVFLLAKGAERWKAEILTADKAPSDLKAGLQPYLLQTAPKYHWSEMKAQPIEPARPVSIFKKCHFMKKAS